MKYVNQAEARVRHARLLVIVERLYREREQIDREFKAYVRKLREVESKLVSF